MYHLTHLVAFEMSNSVENTKKTRITRKQNSSPFSIVGTTRLAGCHSLENSK